MKETTWFVYLLHCNDGSLYCGVTTDLDRRVDEHNGIGTPSAQKKGAKYTKVRRPVALVYNEPAKSRSAACQREAAIKKLTKVQKWQLIHS